ncbi:MAG: glycosyltransferase [Salinivirgaceae bacterium]|nr:glycosyltransferase [Salinivirgaceae bacterium]
MKHIAVLLNGPIVTDSRVIREIRTMSQANLVDLFYVDGSDSDKSIFNENVRLFSFAKPEGFKYKLIRNTCFYNEFLFFVPEVIKQGVKYDYIWANDLPDLKPALQIKRKTGSKVIYDSHEIFIETLNQCFPEKAVIYKQLLYKLCLFIMQTFGRMAEKKMLGSVDEFVTTCESYKIFFAAKYKVHNVNIVMNCPMLNYKNARYDYRKKYGIPKDGFIVTFQGKLIPARALEQIIKSFKYVNNNIYLIIVGDGFLENKLKNIVLENSLSDKIFFTGRISSSDMVGYALGADVGINLQPNVNLSKYYGSTNKFFEYMHAALPMIVSDTPENKLIMAKYDMGIFVSNCNDSQKIAEAINKMSQMDLSRYKENCKKAAEEYNWENQEKVMLNLIK